MCNLDGRDLSEIFQRLLAVGLLILGGDFPKMALGLQSSGPSYPP